jgi:hypothetical protein
MSRQHYADQLADGQRNLELFDFIQGLFPAFDGGIIKPMGGMDTPNASTQLPNCYVTMKAGGRRPVELLQEACNALGGAKKLVQITGSSFHLAPITEANFITDIYEHGHIRNADLCDPFALHVVTNPNHGDDVKLYAYTELNLPGTGPCNVRFAVQATRREFGILARLERKPYAGPNVYKAYFQPEDSGLYESGIRWNRYSQGDYEIFYHMVDEPKTYIERMSEPHMNLL